MTEKMQYEERYDIEKLKFLSSLSQQAYADLTHKESIKKSDIKSNYETFKKFVNESIKKNGKIQPSYSQNDNRGRFYARSPSIQPLSKYVRGFLCSEISTDIDIKNCYPVILKYICDKHKIICPDLSYYVEHRDIIFNEYKSETEDVKKQIFTIMFGGKFSVKNEFVAKFKKEYASIQDKLSKVQEYKNYFDNFEDQKLNKEGASTFKIIEDIEIQVVSKAIDFLKSKNLEILAYMYDGCMIYGNHYKDETLLVELNSKIKEDFENLKIEFVYKNHNEELKEAFDKYQPEEFEESVCGNTDDYQVEKEKFEKFCAKIVDKAVYIVEKFKNGKVYEVNTVPECKLNMSYRHLHYTAIDPKGFPKKVQFLTSWEKDENMRLYENMDVFPPGVQVPNNYYNLWTPFEAEYITDWVEKKEGLKLFLGHIKIICGNNEAIYEYFIKWIACMIQFPSIKTTCFVFTSKEGAGKTTVFNLFRKMLGHRKVMECTSPERDVWGDFNGEMMNTYLVNINELGKKQQSDSVGKIKGLITDQELIINQKGQPQTKIMSYHKFIITTNNEDPIYTDENDRRFLVVRSSDEKKGDFEYFKVLNEALNDPDTIKTCYEYFKNLPDIAQFPYLQKPISKYHENLKELNKPVIVQFLEFTYYLHLDKEEVEFTCQDFYSQFRLWIENNGINYETSSLKLMCSIRNLNYSGISKHRYKTHTSTIFNIKKLKKDLKIIDYFEDGQTLLDPQK